MGKLRNFLGTLFFLLICSGLARAQGNGVVTISVTNVSANITVDRDCNYVIVRENSASPSAVFSITLAGTSTAINYAAGSQFQFTAQKTLGGAPFKSGTVIGTIVATTAGPFSFVAVESYGEPSFSARSGAGSGVTSFNLRVGAVTPQTGDYSATNVGLGSVTNDAQTKAAVMPNTAPGAGQLPVGNAGGTAYAPTAVSGDASLGSTGALTVTKTNGSPFAAVATSGSKSDVGLGSVTNDAQTKAAVVPNTAPGAGQIPVGNAGGTAYAPLTVSGDATLSSAGAMTVTKTGGVAFAASATTDTTAAGNISSGTLPCGRHPALTGDTTSSAGSCATTTSKINGTSLAGLGTGILKNTTGTGVPSIAAATDVTGLFTGCSGTQYLGADGACHTASGGDTTAKYIVGDASVPGDLTNAKSWPSLFNSRDIPPVSRNAMDEECDGASLNSPNNIWTWTNIGASSETQGYGWCSIVNSTSNGSSHVPRFIGQSTPSAPYTFVAKIAVHDPTGGSQGNGGMFLYESGSSKYVLVGMTCSNGSTGSCSMYVASATNNRYFNTSQAWPTLTSSPVFYVQVNRTSSTLTFSYSLDGITFDTLYTAAMTADFTTAPDTVGLGVDPYSSGMVLNFDWFRRTL